VFKDTLFCLQVTAM